jgi:signal transduction histidine kinase
VSGPRRVLKVWNARSGGRDIVLRARPTTVGRSGGGADIELPDPLLARRHARFWVTDAEVWGEDLGSTQGTWLAGHRLEEPQRLSDGVPLVLGETVLALAPEASAEPMEFVDGLEVRARRSASSPLQAEAFLGALVEFVHGLLRSTSEELMARAAARLGALVPAAERLSLVEWPPADDGTLVYLLPGAPVSSSLVRHAAESGEACLLSEVAEVGPSVDFHHIRSAVYAPMTYGGEVLGVLCADTPAAGVDFSPDDFRFLCAVADLLGSALGAERLRDEARQRELEARQLAARREALADILKIASHDLADPLALVVRSARMLQKEPPPSLARELADLTLEAGRWAQDLVHTYLDVAALESGHPLEVQWQAVDLRALVDAEIRLVAAAHDGPRVFNRVACGVVSADRRKIRQVVANLLSNAVKYSPRSAPITVEGEAREGQVLVSVIDEGVGIPEEERQRLFDAFHRAPATSDAAGSGLGLWLAAALVDAHGGSIGVESAGAGSTFWFTIPIR